MLCGREVQLSIKDSVKQLLDDKIHDLGMEGFYESTQHEIRGRNGSLFIFAGLGKMTTDQIKSMEGIDRAWIEEAQTVSASSLEILIPTIRKAGSPTRRSGGLPTDFSALSGEPVRALRAFSPMPGHRPIRSTSFHRA